MKKLVFSSIAILCIIFVLSFMASNQARRNNDLVVPDKAVETIVNNGPAFSEATDDYEVGFREGFVTFLNQSQIYIPMPPTEIVVAYTSDLEEDQQTTNKEQKLKGYVDGYHRAASSSHCPR